MKLAIDIRPMPRRMQQSLRDTYCRRQLSVLWGERRFITPQLLPVVHGDGRQVLAVRPIITRRQHFIVPIDSSIRVTAGEVHEIIDAIYEAHEEHFGPCQCVECGGEPIPGDDQGWKDCDRRFTQWPVICLNGGCEWWVIRQKAAHNGR